MKLSDRGRSARYWRGGRLPLAAAVGLATVCALSFDSGALAERSAAIKQPTLVDLLRRREGPGAPQSDRPADAERLRQRHRELRQRRRRIEEGLGPIGVQRSRRPVLRVPPPSVTTRQVRAVDLDRANPDHVRRQGRR